MAKNPQSNEGERCAALEGIISQAPDIGVEKALKQFGGPLAAAEKDLIRSLTKEELKSLRTIKGKVGGLLRKSTNNINGGNNNISQRRVQGGTDT
jgi:hypothetical protein